MSNNCFNHDITRTTGKQIDLSEWVNLLKCFGYIQTSCKWKEQAEGIPDTRGSALLLLITVEEIHKRTSTFSGAIQLTLSYC